MIMATWEIGLGEVYYCVMLAFMALMIVAILMADKDRH